MPTKILPLTTTLKLKVPSGFYIQPLKDKKSVRKNMLSAIGQLLRNEQMEVVFIGHKQENESQIAIPVGNENSTLVTINIIERVTDQPDFTLSQDALLKRFKKELRENDEHILIDNNEIIDGKAFRNIEVYVKSAVNQKKDSAIKYGYTFSNSLPYAV